MANRAEISASIDIDAPPETVWALISDPTRMPEWSPQCRKMIVRGKGPVGVGTTTLNINRRGLLFWPTRAKIKEFEPNRRFAFKIAENGTIWAFDLEPTATGTTVTESRHAPDGVSDVSNFLTKNVLGGTDNFEAELELGMRQTLARIEEFHRRVGARLMARARVAPLETSTLVDASPDAVWDVLKHQRRMKTWSPETLHQWFYPHRLSHGQISVNLNRRGWFVWPTFSRYVDVARPHRLAFHVYGPAARWGYRLDAEGNGTRLTLRRDLKNDRSSWLSIIIATLALGGPANHDVELVDGMERTLERIKGEAEERVRA